MTKNTPPLPTDERTDLSPSSAESTDGDEVELLVRAAVCGDDNAFGELVGKYERFVYNTACRVLSCAGHPIDAAEDIAQESFIKMWHALPSFRGDCCFSTWLFRITVNTAKDHIRHAIRHQTFSLTRDDNDEEEISEWDVPVTAGDEIPEEALERSETQKEIRRAIESLPEDQRAVVVMRDIHELSYHEISRVLGLELGTVKSRINRGRANLKKLLKNGNFL